MCADAKKISLFQDGIEIVAHLVFATFHALQIHALRIWSSTFRSIIRPSRRIWVLCWLPASKALSQTKPCLVDFLVSVVEVLRKAPSSIIMSVSNHTCVFTTSSATSQYLVRARFTFVRSHRDHFTYTSSKHLKEAKRTYTGSGQIETTRW